jgi:hypothetical protein
MNSLSPTRSEISPSPEPNLNEDIRKIDFKKVAYQTAIQRMHEYWGYEDFVKAKKELASPLMRLLVILQVTISMRQPFESFIILVAAAASPECLYIQSGTQARN